MNRYVSSYLLVATTVLVAGHIVATWVAAWRRGKRAVPVRREKPCVSMPMPLVTILIPAWREATTIAGCLRALSEVTYERWEAIVIAGGPDNTLDVAHAAAATDDRLLVLPQSPGGKNAALTAGLAHAHGSIIVVLDADSLVEPGWLDALLVPIDGGADAACGQFVPRRSTWISQSEQLEERYARDVLGATSLQGSGSIAVTRAALDAVGGFPPDVTVGVDWDLGVRLERGRFRSAFVAEAILTTERPATLSEFWRNEVRWRRAHLRALWRHRGWFGDSPTRLVGQSGFYLVTLGMLAIVPLIVIGVALGAASMWLFGLLAILWVASRRGAFVLTLAAAHGEWRSLDLIWGPTVLVFVSFAATFWAACTLSTRQVHFRGPRPNAM